MDASKKCGNCTYYQGLEFGRTSEEGEEGECRRHSPVLVQLQGDGEQWSETRSPETQSDFWCGDFKKKWAK